MIVVGCRTCKTRREPPDGEPDERTRYLMEASRRQHADVGHHWWSELIEHQPGDEELTLF